MAKMENTVILVLLGGSISLVSTLTTIAVPNWLDRRKQQHETRKYPMEVLFNKQTEFYDKITHLLPEINGYITTVDVWLGETGPDAKRNVKEFAENNAPLWKFNELMESYSIYLPEKILRAGNELFSESIFLSTSPAMEKTERCINLLFSFQNTIRECIGIDRISAELLKAFTTHKQKKNTKGPR